MDEALRRAGLICLTIAAGAYVTYLGSDALFNGEGSPHTVVPIIVRDDLRANQHHLSGMLLVPSTCDQLTVSSKQISNYEYRLVFESWPEPSVTCKDIPSPRVFDTIVFAPSIGVHFSAELDKKPLQIAVYPTVSNQ